MRALSRITDGSTAGIVALGVVLLIEVARRLGVPQPTLLAVVGVGLVGFSVAWWLASGVDRSSPTSVGFALGGIVAGVSLGFGAVVPLLVVIAAMTVALGYSTVTTLRRSRRLRRDIAAERAATVGIR